jgi:hypothetical protein
VFDESSSFLQEARAATAIRMKVNLKMLTRFW